MTDGKRSYAVYAGILVAELRRLEVGDYKLAQESCDEISAEQIYQRVIADLERDHGTDKLRNTVMDVVQTVAVIVGIVGVVVAFALFVHLRARSKKDTTRGARIPLWLTLVGVIAFLVAGQALVLLGDDGADDIGEVAVRSRAQSEREQGGQIPDGSIGPKPTVRMLTVDNQSIEDIVNVRVRPPRVSEWHTLAGTPIGAGENGTLALPAMITGEHCSIDVRIEPDESPPHETTKDICGGAPLVLYSSRRLRVRTVPPGGWLTITREGDEEPVWSSNRPMPSSGSLLRLGRYDVEAKKKGYAVSYGSLLHGPSSDWKGVIPLCRAPSEMDRRFRDCDICPQMEVVPAGCYVMGEGGTMGRTVTIDKPFAVGKYEVTHEQWMACADDTLAAIRYQGGAYARIKRILGGVLGVVKARILHSM